MTKEELGEIAKAMLIANVRYELACVRYDEARSEREREQSAFNKRRDEFQAAALELLGERPDATTLEVDGRKYVLVPPRWDEPPQLLRLSEEF